MDPKQQRALNNCHRDILRDLDIDKQFLLNLYIDNLITEAQSKDIEKETTRRAKAAKLLEILPRRGPSCFPSFVNKLRRDYSWIAGKLDSELEKAEKEIPKDINNKLIDVINQQLTPLVFGEDHSNVVPPDIHPGQLVHHLADTVHTLQYRSFRALGISSKDPATTYMSLPRLIDRKVHHLNDSLNEIKTALAEEKKKNKNGVVGDKKSGKEITKLKKDLEKQKETNKKLESSIKSKNKKLQAITTQNTELESDNRELKIRIKELEKEMLIFNRGAMITEWKM